MMLKVDIQWYFIWFDLHVFDACQENMLVNLEFVSLSVWCFFQVIVFGDQKVKYTKLNEVITIVDSSSAMDDKSEFEQCKRS